VGSSDLARAYADLGRFDDAPTDRSVVIPRGIVSTASAVFPVSEENQPRINIPLDFHHAAFFSSANETSSSTSEFIAV
jgi:hypothetical protein